MERRRILLHALVIATLAWTGCAFVPKPNPRLDEARALREVIAANAEIARLAPREVQDAQEAFESAATAHDGLQDPADVDHLAYVAKQRFEIARETAALRAAQEALARARRFGP